MPRNPVLGADAFNNAEQGRRGPKGEKRPADVIDKLGSLNFFRD
jgi:hypothetical protein